MVILSYAKSLIFLKISIVNVSKQTWMFFTSHQIYQFFLLQTMDQSQKAALSNTLTGWLAQY